MRQFLDLNKKKTRPRHQGGGCDGPGKVLAPKGQAPQSCNQHQEGVHDVDLYMAHRGFTNKTPLGGLFVRLALEIVRSVSLRGEQSLSLASVKCSRNVLS